MPTQRKNSALILGMVAVLGFAKYNIARLTVATPFSQDPCDAVWAFAFFTIALIVVVSVVRAFRPYRNGSASTAQGIFIIRSQQAFALAVFITLVADVIALARHPSMWISAASRNKLLVWLGVFAAVSLATILLLVLCPEWPSDNSSQTAHTFPVVLGALVVFVPIRFLLPVLVPFESDEEHWGRKLVGTVSEWSVLLGGVLMFAFGFWADTHRWGGTLRYLRSILAIAPLLVAYAFLGEPLGLAVWKSCVVRES